MTSCLQQQARKCSDSLFMDLKSTMLRKWPSSLEVLLLEVVNGLVLKGPPMKGLLHLDAANRLRKGHCCSLSSTSCSWLVSEDFHSTSFSDFPIQNIACPIFG